MFVDENEDTEYIWTPISEYNNKEFYNHKKYFSIKTCH